ncbi:nuclear factor 7, ovary-like [Carcharodon carcharias]|uniref:nuclear factor 7, ovary-like n=1 Tax=Carcharodon carcharias TaxID=13397 RepID=UPI001B7E91DA|nr:nuclear factor 7, ovary-like [Carcharodon carcharias]
MAAECGPSLESDLHRELTCSVCLELFREPVALGCGHNFCQGCILHVWESRERQRRRAAPGRGGRANGRGRGAPSPAAGAGSSFSCPECRQIFSDKNFTKNFLAANLVEKLQEAKCVSGSRACLAQRRYEKHQKPLTLYCATDQRILCDLCRLSKTHRSCDILLAHELTDEFLMRKKELKAKIREEFARLIEFLIEEREIFLLQLDEVERAAIDQVEAERLDLGATILELEQSIADIKSKLNHSVPLEEGSGNALGMSKATLERSDIPTDSPDRSKWRKLIREGTDHIGRPCQERAEVIWGISGSARPSKHLLPLVTESADRTLDLSPISRTHRTRVEAGPENLYFNPKTAHPSLRFSGDYTAVESRGPPAPGVPPTPDNPERFNRFQAVLASAHFASGRRYWEVDVGDAAAWHLGITCVHSPRKGYVKLAPANGYWSIGRLLDYWVNAGRRQPLDVGSELSKVGVYLDFDAGRVSFYDACCMALLCTFKTTFHSPVVPFFSPSRGVDGVLRLCHF